MTPSHISVVVRVLRIYQAKTVFSVVVSDMVIVIVLFFYTPLHFTFLKDIFSSLNKLIEINCYKLTNY